MRGESVLPSGDVVVFKLPRSNEGRETLRIAIPAPQPGSRATLEWRRFPTEEPFRSQSMTPSGDGTLETNVPPQPAAGKIEYRILFDSGGSVVSIPATETVIARYRDPVPAAVLIPHILAMFTSMLISTRALFEVLRPDAAGARSLILVSMGLLIVGGLVLGPIVQRFAFGAFWTGWPLGHDLTDNKTLIAFLAWLPATALAWRGHRTRLAVVLGWLVMMGVFLIPHSVRGSQLDWSTVDEARHQITSSSNEF